MRLSAPIPKLRMLKMTCIPTFFLCLIVCSNDRDDDPSKAQNKDFVVINEMLVIYIIIR